MVLEAKSLPDASTGSWRLALGAMASGAVSFAKVALQLLLLPVMARLLGPNEFGLYALTLPTVSLVGLLADEGLGIPWREKRNPRCWSGPAHFGRFS